MASLSWDKQAFPGRMMPEGGPRLPQEPRRRLTQLGQAGHASRQGDLYAE